MDPIIDKTKIDLVWLLSLLIFVSFVLLPVIGHEVLLFASLAALTFISYVLKTGHILQIRWTLFHTYLSIFLLFIYISSYWALKPKYTIGRGNTFLITFFVIAVLSLYCFDTMDVNAMLKIAMLGGYIVAVVGIIFYGFDNVLDFISEGERLTMVEDFLNINELGMCATYAIIINFYYWMQKERKLYTILSIPAFLIMLGSGSRKAIAIFVIGVALLLIINNARSGSKSIRILRIAVSIIGIILALYMASQLSIFAGISERIRLAINGILTGENSDYSTITRLNLIDIGLDIFHEHPYLGIGIGNAQFIVEKIYHRSNYYLHNNYVEMLANGGVVGFIIYYWYFLYLIVMFIHQRKFKDMEFSICFILLVIHLIMDIGAVTYLNRTTYFYLMLFYIKLNKSEDILMIPFSNKILHSIST